MRPKNSEDFKGVGGFGREGVFPESRLCEVIGGPHDGLMSCRSLLGLFVDGVNITHLVNGVSMVGNMDMPGSLILYLGEKSYTYVRFYNEGSGLSIFVYEGYRYD